LNVEKTIKPQKAENIIKEKYYTLSQWKKSADNEKVSLKLRDIIAKELIAW